MRLVRARRRGVSCEFTVFDAREALFRALTGRDRSERAVVSTEAEHNKYWATAFSTATEWTLA
jgi:hypothetical protein